MGKTIKMTEDKKIDMAGLLPMRPGTTHAFTPPLFDGAEPKYTPVFYITQLSNKDTMLIKEILRKTVADTKGKMKDQTPEYMKICKTIIKGWDNLIEYGTDEEIPFSVDMIDTIPEVVLSEIFNEAMKITGFLAHGVL